MHEKQKLNLKHETENELVENYHRRVIEAPTGGKSIWLWLSTKWKKLPVYCWTQRGALYASPHWIHPIQSIQSNLQSNQINSLLNRCRFSQFDYMQFIKKKFKENLFRLSHTAFDVSHTIRIRSRLHWMRNNFEMEFSTIIWTFSVCLYEFRDEFWRKLNFNDSIGKCRAIFDLAKHT